VPALIKLNAFEALEKQKCLCSAYRSISLTFVDNEAIKEGRTIDNENVSMKERYANLGKDEKDFYNQYALYGFDGQGNYPYEIGQARMEKSVKSFCKHVSASIRLFLLFKVSARCARSKIYKSLGWNTPFSCRCLISLANTNRQHSTLKVPE
jgi:hypothetical protein